MFGNPLFVLSITPFAYLLMRNHAERKKDMQNEYKPIQKDTVTENIFAECSEDFILPDYMPEIRRILRLETRLLQGDSFVSGGKADFEGVVLYTLFYTDSEEKLTAVPLESRYHYDVPVGETVPLFVYSTELTEGVNMRPSGPRRLSIRTKIRATVHAVTEEPLQRNTEALLPEGCGEVEYLDKKTDILTSAYCRSELSEVTADFTLEGKDALTLRPLYASAEILTEKASAENGHVLFHGVCCIKVLLEAGGEAFTLSRRVPFEDAMITDCREGDSVLAYPSCHSTAVKMEQNGEDTLVRVTAKCCFEATVRRNSETSVFCDLFAEKKSLTVSHTPLHTLALADAFMGNFTANAECPMEDASVPLSSVSVKEAQLSWEGKRAVLSGECRAELLCYGKEDGDERSHFYAKDFTFPFRIETETPMGVLPTDKKSFRLIPSASEVAVQNEKGYLSSELTLCLYATRQSAFSVPDTVSAHEREERDDSLLSIYYPKDTDSLWSVGKAYGIPCARLAEQNDIPLDGDTALDDPKTLDGMAWVFASPIS